LTAFLAYLIQILMSVMMATFTLIMGPGPVSADRRRGARHTLVGGPPKEKSRAGQRGHLGGARRRVTSIELTIPFCAT
jgi:hypothetical protein